MKRSRFDTASFPPSIVDSLSYCYRPNRSITLAQWRISQDGPFGIEMKVRAGAGGRRGVKSSSSYVYKIHTGSRVKSGITYAALHT